MERVLINGYLYKHAVIQPQLLLIPIVHGLFHNQIRLLRPADVFIPHPHLHAGGRASLHITLEEPLEELGGSLLPRAGENVHIEVRLPGVLVKLLDDMPDAFRARVVQYLDCLRLFCLSTATKNR